MGDTSDLDQQIEQLRKCEIIKVCRQGVLNPDSNEKWVPVLIFCQNYRYCNSPVFYGTSGGWGQRIQNVQFRIRI